MRTIGLLGLVALVALAMAAFVGPGTASAVTLCKSNTNPCPAGERYPEETVLEGAAGAAANSAITSTAMEVKCDEATIEVETLAESASPSLPAKVSFPSFTTCARAGFSTCAQEALSQPDEAEIFANSGNGSLVSESVVLGYECVSPSITCVYSGEVKFSITGGNPATMATSAAQLTKQGGSAQCSATAEWAVGFTISSPTPLFVQSGP